MNKQWVKVRFTSKAHGATAGLVIPVSTLCGETLQGISRMFPYTEALKMERIEWSEPYDTWEGAFGHEFQS